MSSVRNGVSGAIMRHSPIRTSNATDSESRRSSSPRPPSKRSLFIRRYQFVNCSTISTRRGTTVYSR